MNPFPTEDSDLNQAIASAYADLKAHHADDDEHRSIVDQLTQLYKLKHDQHKLNLELYQFDSKQTLETEQANYEHEQNAKSFFKRVDPNTALTVAGNILIGLAVIKYEQTGVISSKVMSFMKKI